MILTAHQPSYLPWCGLFAKIAMADTFVLFDDVQYCPKDYQNRNKIWTTHGPSWLTVPVKHIRTQKIKDIEINNDLPWQRKHWRTIQQSYRKSKYWLKYVMELESIYEFYTWKTLTELDAFIMNWLLEELQINVEIHRASNRIFKGTKSDLILDMFKQLGASTYIFGALGRDYADVAAFDKAGIKVIFQDYHHPIYSQFGGEFMSHLSVIDLLFHHGPKAKEILLT